MREHHLTVARTGRYFSIGPETGVEEVWFVLHGYGQLAARFLAEFASIDDGTRLVVAPEAMSRFYIDHGNRKVGASWMTREDRLTEIDDYVRYLDAVRADVLGGPGARRGTSIHALGFSQGAATAARWTTMGALAVDRLVLWGGEVPPDLALEHHDARARLRRARLTLVAGTRDEYITDKVLAKDTARLDAAGVPYRVIRYDGGHDIDAGVLRRLTADR